jgi:hypothetical protein
LKPRQDKNQEACSRSSPWPEEEGEEDEEEASSSTGDDDIEASDDSLDDVSSPDDDDDITSSSSNNNNSNNNASSSSSPQEQSARLTTLAQRLDAQVQDMKQRHNSSGSSALTVQQQLDESLYTSTVLHGQLASDSEDSNTDTASSEEEENELGHGDDVNGDGVVDLFDRAAPDLASSDEDSDDDSEQRYQ